MWNRGVVLPLAVLYIFDPTVAVLTWRSSVYRDLNKFSDYDGSIKIFNGCGAVNSESY